MLIKMVEGASRGPQLSCCRSMMSVQEFEKQMSSHIGNYRTNGRIVFRDASRDASVSHSRTTFVSELTVTSIGCRGDLEIRN